MCDTAEDRREWMELLSKAIVMRGDIASATDNISTKAAGTPQLVAPRHGACHTVCLTERDDLCVQAEL